MSVLQKACRPNLLYRWPVSTLTTPSVHCNRIINNCLISKGYLYNGGSVLAEGKIPCYSILHSVRLLNTYAVRSIKVDNRVCESVRLAKLIATEGLNMQMSRRSAEGLIESGQVTVAGAIVTDPGYKILISDALGGGGIVKVSGRRLVLQNNSSTSNKNIGKGDGITTTRTRVWLVNKLAGELVSEHDPEGRPSLLERMARSGVGKPSRRVKKKGNAVPVHLKPIGRLDMMTEGLMILTNDGKYAREMELPQNLMHRTYRARVHGRITPGKLRAVRNGVSIEGNFYKGMQINLELNKGNRVKGGNTNSWVRVSCVEGKNRQVRRILDHVGLKVTRLIRTSFGDYDLNTIPSGLAIEVPFKPITCQKHKGIFEKNNKSKKGDEHGNASNAQSKAPAIEWVRYA